VAKKERLSPIEISIVEAVMNEGQLLCYNSPCLENRYHGIRHYIDFVFSQDRIDYYVQNGISTTSAVSDTALKILLEEDYERLLIFIFKFAAVPRLTMNIRDYIIVFYRFACFSINLDEKTMVSLFYHLQKIRPQMGQYDYYIVVFYSVLFQQIRKEAVRRKIAAAIMKDFSRLNHCYQRRLLSSVYFRKAQKLSEETMPYCL
jgi:hypothetical protein